MNHLKIYIFFFCLFIFGCQNNATDQYISQTEISIPELLDRNENLWYGKEWETTQNAYVHAREAIKVDPIAAEEYLKLAQVFTNEARVTGEHGHYYPSALKVLDKAITYADNEDVKFRAMTTKAGVLLSQHEFQQALVLGQQAVQINPYNSNVYGVLVDAYVEMGDYENAVKMADKMISVRPDLRSYARVSYLREIYGDVEGAKEAMRMAVESGFPSYEQTAWTQLTLGELYETYGEEDKALQVYNSILTTRENYPFAIAAKASIMMGKEKYDEAEKLLQEGIAIIPEVGFYEQLAHIYKKQNRKEEFNKIVPEIFAMLKDDVYHGHNMNLEYATIYSTLLEDQDKALEYAMGEYQKRPQNIDVNRMLSMIYFEKNDLLQAGKFAKVAERTGSKHPDLINVKGLLANK
ncbi:MAG: tetratricopeptide repeat protein [Saprospiraceae bacterium]